MNILIDFSQIPVKKAGVGVYAFNLVKQISTMNSTDRYYILVQDDDPDLDPLASANMILLKMRSAIFRKLFFRFLLEQMIIPIVILKYRIRLVHSLHYSFPLITFGCKRIVNIHDLTFYKFPEYHVWIKIYYFRLFIRLSIRFADHVITLSKSSLADLICINGAQKNKISVVYLGKTEWEEETISRRKIDEIKKKYGIRGEYLLFIGTLEPRKNIDKIILAFQKLLISTSEYCLVIVGRKGWKYSHIFDLVSELQIQDKIIFTGFIEEEEKPFLIKGSKLFVYPSMYEGFGLPVLEALSFGIPTITSNVSSMPEVAGDAALLVNPENVDEIYQNIIKVLYDDKFYEELQKMSVRQADKFSWKITAERTVSLYNRAVTIHEE